ncbi:unnamed protein product [Clavelina lepadiformis]|uniref:Uncharacterized protein n=1 Tax=Clavelina lepadiformis TaxID=159417 RepID=A0ABP0FNY8_CLALP
MASNVVLATPTAPSLRLETCKPSLLQPPLPQSQLLLESRNFHKNANQSVLKLGKNVCQVRHLASNFPARHILSKRREFNALALIKLTISTTLFMVSALQLSSHSPGREILSVQETMHYYLIWVYGFNTVDKSGPSSLQHADAMLPCQLFLIQKASHCVKNVSSSGRCQKREAEQELLGYLVFTLLSGVNKQLRVSIAYIRRFIKLLPSSPLRLDPLHHVTGLGFGKEWCRWRVG